MRVWLFSFGGTNFSKPRMDPNARENKEKKSNRR
jgi:hypothetical protein